jgi:hypothetical protein
VNILKHHLVYSCNYAHHVMDLSNLQIFRIMQMTLLYFWTMNITICPVVFILFFSELFDVI